MRVPGREQFLAYASLTVAVSHALYEAISEAMSVQCSIANDGSAQPPNKGHYFTLQ